MKKKKPAYMKYSYNIDTVKAGDKIAVLCDHSGCKNFLVMTVIYPSTMQCSHSKKGPFDMRNQTWTCHSHSIN